MSSLLEARSTGFDTPESPSTYYAYNQRHAKRCPESGTVTPLKTRGALFICNARGLRHTIRNDTDDRQAQGLAELPDRVEDGTSQRLRVV